jgi:two-component system, sporulation sensor kinase E
MNGFPEVQSNIYKLFSDSSNNLLLYLDKNKKIKAINQAVKDKFGISDETDVIDIEYTDFFGVDCTSSVVLESLSAGHEIRDVERLSHLRGRLVYLIIDTKIIRDENGEIQGIVCIFRDITDRKIEEQKLVTIEKQASLGLLAAGIAHEIRNPLTVAMGFIQLMQQSPLDETQHNKYLDLVLNELKST